MGIVPDDYTYTAPDGTEYKGTAAYVLNHLDSAEASLCENFRDVRADPVFSDREVMEEAELQRHLDWLLVHHKELAAYL